MFHCMYIPYFLTHSSIDEHLEYFHLLAIANMLGTWVYKYLFENLLPILLDIYSQKWDCWIIW